jgi:hypothetical protein
MIDPHPSPIRRLRSNGSARTNSPAGGCRSCCSRSNSSKRVFQNMARPILTRTATSLSRVRSHASGGCRTWAPRAGADGENAALMRGGRTTEGMNVANSVPMGHESMLYPAVRISFLFFQPSAHRFARPLPPRVSSPRPVQLNTRAPWRLLTDRRAPIATIPARP